jgi:hypothetical protein
VATCGDRLPGVSPARPHSTAAGRWCRQDGSRSHPATPGAIDFQLHRPVVSLICLDRRDQRAEPGSPSRAAPPGHAPVRQRSRAASAAGIRQLDGQLQVRRAQGARASPASMRRQEARRLGSAWKTESMVTPVFATPILTTSWLA